MNDVLVCTKRWISFQVARDENIVEHPGQTHLTMTSIEFGASNSPLQRPHRTILYSMYQQIDMNGAEGPKELY